MKHLHHIVPKHIGGTDDPNNLVELTVEEHAEAHRKLYEQIIQDILTSLKSEEWKEKNRKPKKDKSKYFGNTNAKSLAGKSKSDEHKKNISLAHIGKKREPFSKEWKQALKDAHARQPVRTCPHCGLDGKGANMTRYHFDNCKRK